MRVKFLTVNCSITKNKEIVLKFMQLTLLVIGHKYMESTDLNQYEKVKHKTTCHLKVFNIVQVKFLLGINFS